MVAIILGREIWVTALRSVAQARGLTIPASPLGKAKMVSQVVAILALLLGREWLPWALILGRLALWVVLLVAVVSAVDYYRRFTVLTSPRLTPSRSTPEAPPPPRAARG